MKHFPLRALFLILLFITLLLFSSEVTLGAKQGLLLWYSSIVPALFPFMVLSGMVVSSGEITTVMSPFYRLLHPLLGLSYDGCYILITGLLCGYPIGAKTCSEFVLDERITVNEGKYLMAICNHPSPMFLLGYVYPLFADKIPVWLFIFTVYTPIIMIAMIAKLVYPFHTYHALPYNPGRIKKCESDADKAILSSIEVLCKIGGYLVIFSIVIALIQNVLPLPKAVRLFLIGIMEMTTGIRELSKLHPWQNGYLFSVASLTFGGISGIFQTKAVRQTPKNKAGLSVRPYIFWKLAHALLSSGLAYLICSNN